MTDNEPLHMSFDNLPRAVAELHSKIDTLTEMVEKLMSANTAQPLSEIMTVEDVSAMLCKSVSTIYAMTSEHRIPYRKQGNKLYFMRTEIKSWLNDSVVPKDAPKRKSGHETKDCGNSPDEPAPEKESGQVEEVTGTQDMQTGVPTPDNCAGQEQQNPPYIIEQRTHSRSGAEIFAVRFSNEYEAAGERKFNPRAREFNGYWSDYGNGGYVFNTSADAENFADAITGKKETEQSPTDDAGEQCRDHNSSWQPTQTDIL